MKPAMEFKLSNYCSQDLADQRILKRQTLNPKPLHCHTDLYYTTYVPRQWSHGPGRTGWLHPVCAACYHPWWGEASHLVSHETTASQIAFPPLAPPPNRLPSALLPDPEEAIPCPEAASTSQVHDPSPQSLPAPPPSRGTKRRPNPVVRKMKKSLPQTAMPTQGTRRIAERKKKTHRLLWTATTKAWTGKRRREKGQQHGHGRNRCPTQKQRPGHSQPLKARMVKGSEKIWREISPQRFCFRSLPTSSPWAIVIFQRGII